MSQAEVWDKLSQKFNTFKDTVDASAADNIEIAWPVILNFINKHLPHPVGLRALDYGCGSGMFCHKLKDTGFDVCGIDISSGMIEKARQNSTDDIEFFVADESRLPEIIRKVGKFDLITSIMALQFVPDVKSALTVLAGGLNSSGTIVFAVHNPDYLKTCGVTDAMDFGNGNVVTIFNRTAQDYNSIMADLGFKLVLEVYPPFTQEFVEKYKPKYPTTVSEYMILAYQNNA